MFLSRDEYFTFYENLTLAAEISDNFSHILRSYHRDCFKAFSIAYYIMGMSTLQIDE